jgi:hypothetical protein
MWWHLWFTTLKSSFPHTQNYPQCGYPPQTAGILQVSRIPAVREREREPEHPKGAEFPLVGARISGNFCTTSLPQTLYNEVVPDVPAQWHILSTYLQWYIGVQYSGHVLGHLNSCIDNLVCLLTCRQACLRRVTTLADLSMHRHVPLRMCPEYCTLMQSSFYLLSDMF